MGVFSGLHVGFVMYMNHFYSLEREGQGDDKYSERSMKNGGIIVVICSQDSQAICFNQFPVAVYMERPCFVLIM